MNKAELVLQTQNHLEEGTSKAAAERAVNAVIEAIKEGIRKDGSVSLIGFGTFSVVERKERVGVNPKTREKQVHPASKTIKFKPGQNLKDIVA